MKITVLAGGESSESEVSIRSGTAVAHALIKLGHSVAFIDPVKEATVFYCSDEASLNSAIAKTNAKEAGICPLHDTVIKALRSCDLVFSALHGGIGENGRLSAMLECLNIPFVGSGSVASALAMDKVLCKRIYEASGILTPISTVYKKGQRRPAVPPKYPCIVKPASGGSSVGASAVHMPSALSEAVSLALKECDTVLIEELICGRELSVSVLNDRPLAVTEIVPKSAFFDYESKYSKNGAREITPAPLSSELYKKALNIAICAHKSLGLNNFSRTDIIIERDTEKLYAIETNAIPGLTEESILPKAAASLGISFTELIKRMLR